MVTNYIQHTVYDCYTRKNALIVTKHCQAMLYISGVNHLWFRDMSPYVESDTQMLIVFYFAHLLESFFDTIRIAYGEFLQHGHNIFTLLYLEQEVLRDERNI